jgi:hypothetical protein
MATVRIRQAYFGQICGHSVLSSLSNCQGYQVCTDTVEIPLSASQSADSYRQGVNDVVYRGLKVDPHTLDPKGEIGMGEDTIHMTFWTHACIFESVGNYRIDVRHKRHWALWMDTASPEGGPLTYGI